MNDKKLRKKPPYSPDFEAFWKAYPTDPNMSKADAFAVWKQLDADDRGKAARAVPAFLVYCREHQARGYRPVHAERFLRARRFDGFAETAQKIAAAETVFVKLDTPQWDAWSSYLRANGGKSPPIARDGGWRFPSEWPPNRLNPP